jgi:hypothetical protein
MVEPPPPSRDLATDALAPVAKDLSYFIRPKGAAGAAPPRRGATSQQRALFGALGGGIGGYALYRGLAGPMRVEGVQGFGEAASTVRGLSLGPRMGVMSRYSLGLIASIMCGSAISTILLCSPPRGGSTA